MLGLWTSWVEANSRAAGAERSRSAVHDQEFGKALASGALQLNEILAKDEVLSSVDQMWNANPFREVIPIDWAGISAALRTVWLRSMREPGTALTALARLNTTLWKTAIDVWSDAGNRWMGTVPAEGHAAARSADKRFAARNGREQPGLPHAQRELPARLGLVAARKRPPHRHR
jgi:polyhydroxyalkanoate synthase